MRRIRVLHVLGQINPSGAETMLRASATQFQSLGCELAAVSTGPIPGSYASALASAGFEILHLPFSSSPGYFVRVFKLFHESRWDIIHLHTERANFYFGLAALMAGKRVVRTVHSAFGFRGALKWRRGLQRRLLERGGLQHVAISPTVLENERNRFGIRPALVENWYNDAVFGPPTPDERSQARHRYEIDGQRPVMVTIGNCSSVKNHKSILQAMAILAPEERPLYLHGGAEDESASERKLCSELGLDGDVRFLGSVADVKSLLHACDVFCMPSLYEGFGIAAIEALGCGRSALFTDVPGLADFKVRFPDLCYCEPKPESIADGLRRLLAREAVADENERIAASKTRAMTAKAHYGMARGAKAYLNLYLPENYHAQDGSQLSNDAESV